MDAPSRRLRSQAAARGVHAPQVKPASATTKPPTMIQITMVLVSSDAGAATAAAVGGGRGGGGAELFALALKAPGMGGNVATRGGGLGGGRDGSGPGGGGLGDTGGCGDGGGDGGSQRWLRAPVQLYCSVGVLSPTPLQIPSGHSTSAQKPVRPLRSSPDAVRLHVCPAQPLQDQTCSSAPAHMPGPAPAHGTNSRQLPPIDSTSCPPGVSVHAWLAAPARHVHTVTAAPATTAEQPAPLQVASRHRPVTDSSSGPATASAPAPAER